MITKQSLTDMINGADEAKKAQIIGRALLVLFNNQLESERHQNAAVVLNLAGFNQSDARRGCIGAKYFIKHGTLLDWMVEYWMTPNKNGVMRIVKYWRQLDEAARIKASQREAA